MLSKFIIFTATFTTLSIEAYRIISGCIFTTTIIKNKVLEERD